MTTYHEQPGETTITIVESTSVPATRPIRSMTVKTSQPPEVLEHPFLDREMVAIFAVEDPQDEQELYTLRCSQAQRFQEVASQIATDLKKNILKIGWLLVHGDKIGLHTYLDIPSMQDWMSQIGIKRPMQKLAIRLAKISPYLESLGFDPQTILSPDMDETKAIYLGTIQQDANRQIKSLLESGARQAITGEEEVQEERQEDILDFDQEDEMERLSSSPPVTPSTKQKVETPYFDQLSRDQQEQIQEKALEEYVTRARVEVKRALALSSEDLITETGRTQGKPVIPTFAVTHLTWDERESECTGTFTLKYSRFHEAALRQGKYDIYFRIDSSPNTIPLKDLPDVIAHLMHDEDEEEDDIRKYL